MALDNNPVPDLTKRPPRSPRVRLGGYALLPRMLDKGRATLAVKNGEYHYACPMDQRFLDFTGLSAAAFKKLLAAGKGDGEILEWVQKNAKPKRTDAEIAAWSEFAERRVPGDAGSRKNFNEPHHKTAPKQGEGASWVGLFAVVEHLSFR